MSAQAQGDGEEEDDKPPAGVKWSFHDYGAETHELVTQLPVSEGAPRTYQERCHPHTHLRPPKHRHRDNRKHPHTHALIHLHTRPHSLCVSFPVSLSLCWTADHVMQRCKSRLSERACRGKPCGAVGHFGCPWGADEVVFTFQSWAMSRASLRFAMVASV